MYHHISVKSVSSTGSNAANLAVLFPLASHDDKAGGSRTPSASSSNAASRSASSSRGTNRAKLPKALKAWDQQVGGALTRAWNKPELHQGDPAVQWVYPEVASGSAKAPERVFLVPVAADDPTRITRQALTAATDKLMRAAWRCELTQLQLMTELVEKPFEGSGDLLGQVIGETAGLTSFTFRRFKGAASRDSEPARRDLKLHAQRSVNAGIKRGLEIAASVNEARGLAATPPNELNPKTLAAACRALARKRNLTCQVITGKAARDLKLGGLLAVGQGGSEPPAMIILKYEPKGTGRASSGRSGSSRSAAGSRKSQAPVMLVGKAVTFDTGGYSLKTGGSMATMKYDMCGGAAVIGAMDAVAKLKPRVPVVGVIPAAENMIDTHAYRVDDIITLTNGVTVEVTNTDAEGRLILADALAYGCKTFKPRAVVDLATLTGGVVVALGKSCAGMFCADEKLSSQLTDVGEQTRERLWRLPLWPEHRKLLESQHADICNAGGREAHPIQGAAFLSYFVPDDVPWAHLDIAGTAHVDAAKPPFEKGPTGFGVKLLTQWIMGL